MGGEGDEGKERPTGREEKRQRWKRGGGEKGTRSIGLVGHLVKTHKTHTASTPSI